jgi:UPF0755 protein
MHNKKVRGWGKAILVLVCLILVAFTSLELFDYIEFRPTGDGDETVDFVIEDGQTWNEVLENLQEDGLIRSAKFTSYLLKLYRGKEHYAGTYELNNGMSAQQILETLSDSENAKNTTVQVTITPGSWAKDVAANLATLYPQYTADEFLEKWNDIDYITELSADYTFLDPEVLNNPDLKVKLEGYLYPETYYCDEDMDIDQITRMILTGFNSVYQEYYNEFESISEYYSVQDIVTMASLVQFEAGDESQMKDIAGVFYNRLNTDMMLQSSVTVCYALYEEFSDATACETNYDIDSPYNTYLYEGLPAGPICNPGKAAIEAALNPNANGYLFFVADVNNVKDGGIYYSSTYEEHLALMDELGLTY